MEVGPSYDHHRFQTWVVSDRGRYVRGVQEPLTPDFYRYAWAPITSAVLAEDTVTVSWADGAALSCYSLWLYENGEATGLEPHSRESTIDPGSLPQPDALISAHTDEDGALALTWQGGFTSRVHPGWLHHVAVDQHVSSAYLPVREPWTSNTFSEPPTIDGRSVLSSPDTLRQWLSFLTRYGLARLRNTPADEDFLEALIEQIGPIRGSNFGKIFSVRSVLHPDSTANTGLALGPHTDLPTREHPPGYQFLHCIRNEVSGGRSSMTDGLSVVAALRAQYPEDFDALTTLPWVWFNRQRSEDHRWVGPVIELDRFGQLHTLRAFYPVRGFPHMAPREVPRAYAALRRFSEVSHDPALQISYPFAPGDLVGFDNRQILHGRTGFDPGAGTRVLRGCYLDQDDVYSRLRVLERGRSPEQ
jgi:gamma-butyrobetaine dioxygenase